MCRDTPPAIIRDVSEADKPTTVPMVTGRPDTSSSDKIIRQPKDTVTSIRGFGDSGYRVQVVEHDCPACDFDRMIRRINVSSELRNSVSYWCLNPNCKHFVSDELSYACGGSYPQRHADEPTVSETP